MTRHMPATHLTTLMKKALSLLCCTVLMAVAASAQKKTRAVSSQSKSDSPNLNYPPPPGAILDLTGTPIPGGGNGTYQQYTVKFTATISSTAITFAFRDDPAFLSVAEASVVDLTNPNGNLLVNGDFSGGTTPSNGNPSAPTGWTFANQYGASDYGVVSQGSCSAPLPSPATFCWYDGSVQAYDAISQTIATTVGDTYQVSFWVAENSSCSTDGGPGPSCIFSDLSTNSDVTDTGGNGINVTVYAQNGLPPPTQPLNVTLLDSGSGTVIDNTTAINCSETNGTVTGPCSANYAFNASITLTAQENIPPSNPPSTFMGWGGDCASFGPNTQCTLTMNGTKNVTATFDLPGQTQTGTVPPNQPSPTVFNYNGGYMQGNPNSGFDYTAQETDTQQTVQMAVTVIPQVSQAACNALVRANLSFQTAECFVYQNGGGPGSDVPAMFEVTCPPNGSCGSNANPFDANLASDFSFSCGENSPLGCPTKPPAPPDPGSFGLPHLTPSDGLPSFGFLKGTGPDQNHPCTPYPGNNPPLFQSNQIISFNVVDPGSKPIKGGSAGSTSCWVATYETQVETPSVTISQPVNNGVYQQHQSDATTLANYACTAVNTGNAPAGPYLTVATCSATDNPGGPVGNGVQFDTSTTGPHTFTAQVQDSAYNTNSATVTYNVTGSQTINFPAIPTQTYGVAPLTLGATASSGLTVGYTVTLGPATVIGNVLTIIGPGSVTVQATQTGNSYYAPATPVSQTFLVNQASTATTVLSSLNPAVYGQSVTFTANLASVPTGAGTPTGTVQFAIDGVNFGSVVTLSGTGSATSGSISTLTAGSHTVTATYSGDTHHVSGTPGTLSGGEIVNKAATTTLVASSLDPSLYGQAVSFTAKVGPVAPGSGIPTGTVQFVVDGSNFGSPVALSGGLATSSSVSTLTAGAHTVSATYNGDTNDSGSPGALTGGQLVDQAPAITSAHNATFTLGALNSFTVTTSGFPTTNSIVEAGGLPSGVSFTYNNNGTGTLSGTPTVGGTFNITFTATNGINPAAVQNFTLTTSGPLLSLTPTSFNFGTVNFNFYLNTAFVTVKNIGTSTVNFSNVSLTLGAGTKGIDFTLINLCPSTLAAGKTCYISVIFFAGNVGTVSATVNVADNAPGSPQHISLSAIVINPQVNFNPSRLNFGTVRVGHSNTQNVILSNAGTTPLAITNVSVTGANAHDFVPTNPCPSSLPPNGQCTIAVTFTPSATGNRSANLTVTDNAPFGTQNVPLSGRGN